MLRAHLSRKKIMEQRYGIFNKESQKKCRNILGGIHRASADNASITEMLIGIIVIKDYLLNPQLQKEDKKGKIYLDVMAALVKINEKIESLPDNIALDAKKNFIVEKAFILEQLELMYLDPKKVRGFLSYYVDGNKYYFICNNHQIVGGEANIHFGYGIGSYNTVSKKVLRLIHTPATTSMLEDSEEKTTEQSSMSTEQSLANETNVNKILYVTSNVITVGNQSGYIMEQIPGIDFMKTWKGYDCIAVDKTINDEEKPADFKPEDIGYEKMVLSRNYVYWVELVGNDSLVKYENWSEKHTCLGKSFLNKNDTEQFKITDATNVTKLAKNIKCSQSMGLDCRDFNKLKLTFLQRIQIVRDIYKQLAILHAKGHYHGDISPTNIKIQVDNAGNAHGHLFDFGKSEYIGTRLTITKELFSGTSGFVAPESAPRHSYQAKEFGKQADMYSMAGIAGMMFTECPNDFLLDKFKKMHTQAGDDYEIAHTNFNFEKLTFPHEATEEDKQTIVTLIRESSVDVQAIQPKMVGNNCDNLGVSVDSIRPLSHKAYSDLEGICVRLEQEKGLQRKSPPKLAGF